MTDRIKPAQVTVEIPGSSITLTDEQVAAIIAAIRATIKEERVINPNAYYDRKDVADLIGRSEMTVYSLYKQGLRYKEVAGTRLVKGEWLIDFIEDNPKVRRAS